MEKKYGEEGFMTVYDQHGTIIGRCANIGEAKAMHSAHFGDTELGQRYAGLSTADGYISSGMAFPVFYREE